MSLLPVEDALKRVMAAFTPLAAETVPLSEALGRTTADDIKANLTQPPFDASAMDGYAVLAEDGEATLDLIGEAPAGKSFSGTVKKGQAVRIFTGAPLPDGADTVVMQENTERPDEGHVHIVKAADKGRNIRLSGNDFRAGETLVIKGTVINARHMGLLAAANVPTLSVSKRPKVALLATGDELVNVGEIVGPDQIISSNSLLLSTLITEQGGEAIDLGIARDTKASLKEKIAQVHGVDLFITIGGASVGDHDLVQDVLGEEGLKVDFWKVAIRPGKPLIFGDFKDIPMLGLPGNPASAFVCAANFMVPALHKMLARQYQGLQQSTACLGHDLPENGSRRDYMRAFLSDDGKIVKTAAKQDSAKLSTLAHADCFLVRAPHAPAAKEGEPQEILLLTP